MTVIQTGVGHVPAGVYADDAVITASIPVDLPTTTLVPS